MPLILDWNKPKRSAMKKYVTSMQTDGETQIFFRNENRTVVENVIFRNFPHLHIDKNQMISCHFENCGTVSLAPDYVVAFCTFHNTAAVFYSGLELFDCEFSNCNCTEGALVTLSNGRLVNCKFRNITLADDTFLVSGSGSVRGTKIDSISTARSLEDMFNRDCLRVCSYFDSRPITFER